MESFVSSIVTEVSSTSIAFITSVVTGFWGTILSVLFVGFMISLFWWLARKVFGHRGL